MTQPTLRHFVEANAVPACSVCALPEELANQVRDGRFANPKLYTYTRIADWLKAVGHPISEASLRRHFKHVESPIDRDVL